MSASLVRRNSLAAFTISVIVAALYFIVFLVLASFQGEQTASPNLLGHLGFIWLPVVLSGALYFWATQNMPLSLGKRLIQVIVAAALAPSIAMSIILFVGFVFLGWQM